MKYEWTHYGVNDYAYCGIENVFLYVVRSYGGMWKYQIYTKDKNRKATIISQLYGDGELHITSTKKQAIRLCEKGYEKMVKGE